MAYQLTFAPTSRWSEYYASGRDIQQYYEHVVKEYGVERHIELRDQVLSAVWNEVAKKRCFRPLYYVGSDLLSFFSTFSRDN